MKILVFITFFLTFISLFAQNTPATKDDIKMILEQMREDNRILREDMNKRFEMIQHSTDKRFEQVDNRFGDMYQMFIFAFGILASLTGGGLGFLYVQNQSIIKLIGRSSTPSVQNSSAQEKPVTPEPLPKIQRATEEDFDSKIISLLKSSDEKTKRKLQQLLEIQRG